MCIIPVHIDISMTEISVLILRYVTQFLQKLWLISGHTFAFGASMLLVGQQEGHSTCNKLECWGTGMVICLELGADLHMAQLMLLPLTGSCFSKIQIGFTFLVPAHPGSPGKRPLNGCVCVCVN